MQIKPHVELLKYRGKNGSFAVKAEALWIARFITVDGIARNIDQMSWHGRPDEVGARAVAQEWARELGLEMIEREDVRDARESGFPPAFGTY